MALTPLFSSPFCFWDLLHTYCRAQTCPQGGQQPDNTQKSRQHSTCHATELYLAGLGVSIHPRMVPCPISTGYCSVPQPPLATAISFPGCTEQASLDSARVCWQTPADNKKPCVTPARPPHHSELTAYSYPHAALRRPHGITPHSPAPAHLGPPPPRAVPGPPPLPRPASAVTSRRNAEPTKLPRRVGPSLCDVTAAGRTWPGGGGGGSEEEEEEVEAAAAWPTAVGAPSQPRQQVAAGGCAPARPAAGNVNKRENTHGEIQGETET